MSGKHANKVEKGILNGAVNVIHAGINTLLTQTGLRSYHCCHRPITAIACACLSGCVCVRACVLAEGSFSVTGAIAGIVAEQVSTQLSWVRPAAIHVGR